MTVIVIYRRLQSKTTYFLASLAVSDLLLIIVGVPFDLVSLWSGSMAPAIIGYCEFTSKWKANLQKFIDKKLRIVKILYELHDFLHPFNSIAGIFENYRRPLFED